VTKLGWLVLTRIASFSEKFSFFPRAFAENGRETHSIPPAAQANALNLNGSLPGGSAFRCKLGWRENAVQARQASSTKDDPRACSVPADSEHALDSFPRRMCLSANRRPLRRLRDNAAPVHCYGWPANAFNVFDTVPACLPPLVWPLLSSQVSTSPVVELRHRMSVVPSPL